MPAEPSAARVIVSRCARATGGACANAICWLLWIALSISAGLMVFVHFKREVTVPDFVLRRLEKELRGAQLRAEFGRTNLDLQGVLLLENVRVFGEGFADPLIEARAIRVEFNPWMLAIGHVDPHQIAVDGGQLNCPAPLSPSGVAEPVISELRLHADRRSRSWSISTADLRVGTLRIHSALEVDDSVVRRTAAPSADPLLTQLLRALRQVAAVLPELQRVERPRLELTVRELAANKIDASMLLDVALAEVMPGIQARDVEVAADYASRGWSEPAEIPCRVAIGSVTAPSQVNVTNLHASTRVAVPFAWPVEPPKSALVWADAVSRLGDRVDFPRARLEQSGAAAWHARIDAAAGGEPLQLDGVVDPRAGTGSIRLDARLAEPVLNDAIRRIAAWRTSNFLSRLTVHSTAQLQAHVALQPGWRVEKASAAVRLASATSSEIPLRDTRAELTFDGRELDVHHLILRQGDAEVRGSYRQNVLTQDYRFLLVGPVFPERINGWFSEWWPRLWKDFDFRGLAPLADVDVRGRWQSPDLSVVAGRLIANPLTLRGVPLERADVSFFIRPEHYDIVRFEAQRGAQFAVGTFTRRDDPETHYPRRIDFDFHSNLPLNEGAVFFGEEGRSTVEPYQFAIAPDVEARGRIDWADGRSREEISARVKSTGTFRFNGFPVENARFAFTLRNNDIDLQELTADLAGGKLTGRATVTGPSDARRLWFGGALRDSDLAGTMKTWNEFRAATGDTAATARSNSVATNLGTRGRLDLQVDATGPLDNLMALRGIGRASVVGAELGQVQMLGFLSRLLQGSIFGFTSLRFTNADAQFRLEEDWLTFTKLTFTGPSSRLEAKGRYRMPDELLDFHVSLRPFRESDFALANLIGIMLSPIAAALEVRLSGNLAEPKWAFSAGPSNFFRSLERSPAPTGFSPLPGGPTIPTLFPAPAPASPASAPAPPSPSAPSAPPPPAH